MAIPSSFRSLRFDLAVPKLGKILWQSFERGLFYIDLLFYHIPSHRYVAVELKAEDFKPEHTGQMNFYLAVLDDKVKTELDFPSIGLILCKKKSKFIAEYSLRHINNLMAVSGYGNEAVEELLLSLPSVEEIEAELDKEMLINA